MAHGRINHSQGYPQNLGGTKFMRSLVERDWIFANNLIGFNLVNKKLEYWRHV